MVRGLDIFRDHFRGYEENYLKVFGYRGGTVEQVLAGLKIIYGVDG